MTRTLIALCLFGLLVATAMARPHRRGGKGGKGGKKDGGPGRILFELTCEREDLERGGIYKRDCDEGANCALGPLIYVDEEMTPVKTVKFCDALDVNGTSLVAAAACKITDLDGNILEERTKPEHPDREEDSSEEDREPPACDLPLDIVYYEEPAKAYYPNKACGGHKGKSHEDDGGAEEGGAGEGGAGEDVPEEQQQQGAGAQEAEGEGAGAQSGRRGRQQGGNRRRGRRH